MMNLNKMEMEELPFQMVFSQMLPQLPFSLPKTEPVPLFQQVVIMIQLEFYDQRGKSVTRKNFSDQNA